MNALIPTPTEADAEKALAESRILAALNYRVLVEVLGERSMDPTISPKQQLEYAEHFFKASGLAAKKEAEEQSNRVVVNINFGGKSLHLGEKVVEPVIEIEHEAAELLGQIPAYMSAAMPSALSDIDNLLGDDNG